MLKENKKQKQQQPTEQQLVTIDMLKMFYDRDNPLINNDGISFEVPEEGTLGLLSLGHIGLIEWRKSKTKHLEQLKKNVK